MPPTSSTAITATAIEMRFQSIGKEMYHRRGKFEEPRWPFELFEGQRKNFAGGNLSPSLEKRGAQRTDTMNLVGGQCTRRRGVEFLGGPERARGSFTVEEADDALYLSSFVGNRAA